MSLINDLVNKIKTVASEQETEKITSAKVRLGALSHISAEHFREHFEEGTKGTIAEGARLDIEVSDDVNDPKQKRRHIVLLAKNEVGYRNLLSLNYEGYVN